MTSLSDTVPGQIAVPRAEARSYSLDRARTFITLLVVANHAAIAYTYFGHADRQSWLGFDGFILFNDSFFMQMMFLLSGVFVWTSLRRKGVAHFLWDRILRLGLPFAIGVLVLIPVAYYALALRTGHQTLVAFWWKTVTVGPWPSGPMWFLIVLLACNVVAAALSSVAPDAMATPNRWVASENHRPERVFLAFVAASIVVYVPAVLHYGSGRWFEIGPIVVQASRVWLYLLYFFVGIAIGAAEAGRKLLAADGELAQRWRLWLVLTIVSYGCIIGLVYLKHSGMLPDPNAPPLWWDTTYALVYTLYSAAQTFNILALFIRFDSRGWSVFDPLQGDAYGIYLVHYVPVLWLQYALLDAALTPVAQLTAIVKALIVFVVTLGVSWMATAALRQIPGAARVL